MDNENIKLKDIVNFIDQGIEMAGWFREFIFISMHNNGFIIAKIKYGVDLDAQYTMLGMENKGYKLAYLETFQELGNIINIIELEYDKEVDLKYNTKEELNLMSYEIMHEYTKNPLELSTIIMKGCNDFWVQLFLDGVIYRTDYDSIDGEVLKEKYLDRWKFYIRELATHKTLDDCVDHMLVWFGA